MRNRFRDALLSQGACNPRGLMRSVVAHMDEMANAPRFTGTDGITSDPALRLMVYQLAFLFRTYEIDAGDPGVYSKLYAECEARAVKEG